MPQGHSRSRLAFLDIYIFKLLENSRPTACYFQWNSWKLLDQFQNFSKHGVIKDFTCCNSRLLFGVMTFNQQRKFILAAEKNLLFSIKTLSLCFFLEGFFLFFDLDCQNLATLGFDNCPISEKEKSLSEKATSALSFSTSEEVFSSC